MGWGGGGVDAASKTVVISFHSVTLTEKKYQDSTPTASSSALIFVCVFLDAVSKTAVISFNSVTLTQTKYQDSTPIASSSTPYIYLSPCPDYLKNSLRK